MPATCWNPEARWAQGVAGVIPECMQVGMGQDGTYDCSGFMAAASSRVVGRHVEDWPTGLRHVRDMMDEVPLFADRVAVLRTPAQFIGELLVMSRRWDMDDGTVLDVPGHIGIVTGVNAANVPVLLHARAASGVVVEQPMRTTEHVIGAIRSIDLVRWNSGRLACAAA